MPRSRIWGSPWQCGASLAWTPWWLAHRGTPIGGLKRRVLAAKMSWPYERSTGATAPDTSTGLNSKRSAAMVRLIVCLLSLMSLQALPAAAQSWPSRPVTVIVGFPAGAGIDIFARFLADGLRERTGQPFIVENRPGAASNIAAQAVARAAPDGHTVLYTANATHAANIHLFKNIGFDPMKDFAPVTTFLENGWLLVANAGLPVKSVAE